VREEHPRAGNRTHLLPEHAKGPVEQDLQREAVVPQTDPSSQKQLFIFAAEAVCVPVQASREDQVQLFVQGGRESRPGLHRQIWAVQGHEEGYFPLDTDGSECLRGLPKSTLRSQAL